MTFRSCALARARCEAMQLDEASARTVEYLADVLPPTLAPRPPRRHPGAHARGLGTRAPAALNHRRAAVNAHATALGRRLTNDTEVTRLVLVLLNVSRRAGGRSQTRRPAAAPLSHSELLSVTHSEGGIGPHYDAISSRRREGIGSKWSADAPKSPGNVGQIATDRQKLGVA